MYAQSILNILTILLSISILTTTLSGCRITGGGGSNASVQFEKPMTKWASAHAPLVLNMNSPKARFRVDVKNNFGGYKKRAILWNQMFFIGKKNKKDSTVLLASIYKSDGITLLMDKITLRIGHLSVNPSTDALTPTSKRKGGLFNIPVVDIKLHPDSPVAIACGTNEKICETSFIYEIELVNEQSERFDINPELTVDQGIYVGSQVDIHAHKECFTFLACVDGKNVKSIRPSVSITRIELMGSE